MKTAARLAVAAFLLAPIAQFLGWYLWNYRSLDGIEAALVEAAFAGIGDMLIAAINDPARTTVYLLFLAVLSHFAFKS